MEQRAQFLPLPRTVGHGFLTWLQTAIDPLAAIVCLAGSAIAWRHPFRPADLVLGVMAALLVYSSTLMPARRLRDIARGVMEQWLKAAGALWILGLATGMLDLFDPHVLLTWFLATPILQIAAHLYAPPLLRRLATLHRPQRAIVVGANELGIAFTRSMHADVLSNTRVVAFFDDRETSRLALPSDGMLAGRIADVGAYVRAGNVDQIYIALPMASQRRVLALLEDLRDTTASIFFVPDIFMIDLIQARVDSVGGFPIVAVCESPFRGLTGALKRLTDIVFSSVALIVLAPLLALIAIAIWLDSPGPIIFKQRRFGLDGREIIVYKFRSMTVVQDGWLDYQQVTPGDSRVTRVGRLLRRTSLDELPQFANVLQGRMSVVGPRPHAIAVNEQYRKLIPGYMIRHKVRPGITGWAQVNGYRGGDDLEHMSKRIQYDLDYLRTWSIWLDVRIILRTIAIVFHDEKAY